MFGRRKKIQEDIDDIEIDSDRPFIDPDLPEINDVRPDRFGMPLSSYYLEYNPDFKKSQREGTKARERLSKRYGF